MIRAATERDMDRLLFKDLWWAFLVDHWNGGGEIKPTRRSLDFFTSVYESFVFGITEGCCFFGDDDAVILWGDPPHGSYPYDLRWGRVAIGYGTFVRKDARRKGLSKALYEAAGKELAQAGFDAVMGAVHPGNTNALAMTKKAGFTTVQQSVLLNLEKYK